MRFNRAANPFPSRIRLYSNETRSRPVSELAIQHELDRGHFTTPADVVASALRLLNSHDDWLQENRETIHERLELSFEQSRNGQTYTPHRPANSSPSAEQAAGSE